MARPRKISDEQIIDAACALFLRHGHGASTTEIARAAGVSEGTIFKRFGTKDALFRRALECGGSQWAPDLSDRVGAGEMHQQLQRLAQELIVHFQTLMPRMLHLMTHQGFDPKAYWRDNNEAAPLVALRTLTDHIAAEVALGRIRRLEPQIVARNLLATTHNYAFMELMGIHHQMPMDSETYARGIADLIWNGVAPTAPDLLSPQD